MVEPIVHVPGEPHERRPALGYVMVAIAATLFAVNGTVSKVILGSGVTAEQLTEVRCAGALIGLVLLAALTRPGSLRIRLRELPLLVALGVIGLALVQWSYFFAIHRLEIGIALLIQFVGPVLVALWARFVYGEPVRQRIWLALMLALAGLTLIVEVWHYGRLNSAGVIAAVVAAITYAGSAGAIPSRCRPGDSSSPRFSGQSPPPGGASRAGESTTTSRYSGTSPRATCRSGSWRSG
jgi:drug/metabolite transporter (DMT)-like permease